MPLVNSSSDKARSENIRREYVEGQEPLKQAIAIAYSVQRKAKGKKSYADKVREAARKR